MNRILLFLLILCSAAVYLAGNGRVALWDRDEPRYAQTSRQMLQSGDWVVPHFLDNIRTAKPALIYWCEATAMAVFGDNEFAARFPSAIATTLLLIVLSLVLWRPIGAEKTVWTVFIFATSGLTIAAAKMCITDAVLLLWVTIAQICLYAMYRGNRSWRVVITLAVAHGIAELTKGPVILGIQGMTLLALWILDRIQLKFPSAQIEDLPILSNETIVPQKRSVVIAKIVVGVVIVLAIFVPWVLMVNYKASGFLWTSLKLNVWDRMMTPLEQHKGPPGYYFLTIWFTFFPWSLLLPLAIGVASHRRADVRARFALAAIIGPWIMLECVRTKLPHYFLPVFPPLAFLTADALVRCIHGEIHDLQSKGFLIPAAIWAVLIALATSGSWIVIKAFSPLPLAAMTALSILGICFGLTVFLLFARRQITAAAITMGLGTFAFVLLMYLWYLPNAGFLRVSNRVADILIQHGVTQPHQVIMLDYMEPSLAFAQGGTLREAGVVGFSHKFEPMMPPWLVLTKTIWDKAPQDVRDDFDVVGKVFGLAYADRGKWVTVMVIHKKH